MHQALLVALLVALVVGLLDKPSLLSLPIENSRFVKSISRAIIIYEEFFLVVRLTFIKVLCGWSVAIAKPFCVGHVSMGALGSRALLRPEPSSVLG